MSPPADRAFLGIRRVPARAGSSPQPFGRPRASAAAGTCPAVPLSPLLLICFCSLSQDKRSVVGGERER